MGGAGGCRGALFLFYDQIQDTVFDFMKRSKSRVPELAAHLPEGLELPVPKADTQDKRKLIIYCWILIKIVQNFAINLQYKDVDSLPSTTFLKSIPSPQKKIQKNSVIHQNTKTS